MTTFDDWKELISSDTLLLDAGAWLLLFEMRPV